MFSPDPIRGIRGLLFFVIGCPIPLDDAPCPCVLGYYCCPETQICTPRGDASCFGVGDVPSLVLAGEIDVRSATAVIQDDDTYYVLSRDGELSVFAEGLRGAPKAQWTTPAPAQALLRSNNVTLVGSRSQVQLFNASGAAFATVSLADEATDLAWIGDFVMAADARAGVKILDIRDPQSPFVTAAFPARSPLLTSAGLVVPAARRVRVRDALAFVAEGPGGLLVLDVTQPDAPGFRGRYPENRRAEDADVSDVALWRHYAVLADGSYGVTIADVATPTFIHVVGRIDIPATRVVVLDDYAYVGNELGWVFAIQLADVAHPVVVATFDAAMAVLRLVALNEQLLVCTDGGPIIALKKHAT